MKKSIVLNTLFLVLIGIYSCTAQTTSDEKSIKECITAFAEAGDNSDSKKLDQYLDDNYRVVMNQLFGSTDVSVISKVDYLKKIESKEWGGDTRELTIEDIVINKSIASAKVTFKGKKMTFISIMVLAKDNHGNWKLLSDNPMIG